MMEALLKIGDARRYWLSQQELERRWRAVRARMAARKIDYLVIQSQQRYVGGYFRWFTDIAAANNQSTAVFPLDGEMTIISHGPAAPANPVSPPEWALRGVRERINTPAFPNIWWEDGWEAEKAVKVMMRKKPKTIGLVGLGNMSAALYENLKKGMPKVNIINGTDLVDEIKMVKSEEEIRLHREAAYLHEMSYEVAKNGIRPGRTATEVIAEIRYAQMLAGSEEQQIAIIFGRPGSSTYSQSSYANIHVRRPFQEGDVVNLLIESSTAGGYWYDLRRFFSVGPVPRELQEAHEIVKEARDIMAAHSKPGVSPAVAAKACDNFLKSKGCPPEMRMAGHGQGIDLVERPIYRKEEPAKLKAGMVVSFHPSARTKRAMASLADTYIITDSGAVPLYKNLCDDNEIAIVG